MRKYETASSLAERLALVVVLLVSACRRGEKPLGVGDTLHGRDERGNEIELRIDGIDHDPGADDYALYTLSMRSPSGAYVPYCEPDAAGLRRAIPVRGSWDANGNRTDDAGAMTLACTNGAFAWATSLGATRRGSR